MQDRFRYRVWDKTQDKWLHFDFSTYPTYQDKIWQALTDGETFYQCTGLKDKNGKLIYEGDIVKFNFDTDEIKAVISWDDKELIGFYLNTTDYFKDKYVTDYDFYKNDYEVIGNIYENPELLED